MHRSERNAECLNFYVGGRGRILLLSFPPVAPFAYFSDFFVFFFCSLLFCCSISRVNIFDLVLMGLSSNPFRGYSIPPSLPFLFFSFLHLAQPLSYPRLFIFLPGSHPGWLYLLSLPDNFLSFFFMLPMDVNIIFPRCLVLRLGATPLLGFTSLPCQQCSPF